MAVSKDMSIGEIVQKLPDAGPIMMKFGLHCIGCMVSQFETLEQGCKAHGMDDSTIKKMVDEINELEKE